MGCCPLPRQQPNSLLWRVQVVIMSADGDPAGACCAAMMEMLRSMQEQIANLDTKLDTLVAKFEPGGGGGTVSAGGGSGVPTSTLPDPVDGPCTVRVVGAGDREIESVRPPLVHVCVSRLRDHKFCNFVYILYLREYS